MLRKALVLLLVLSALGVQALDNGLARTPPMGWMTWERFRCNTDCVKYPDSCISANLMKVMAKELVEGGYRDAGYQYVNVDDCWMAWQRDAMGQLQADPSRFPGGMKPVADYIHSLGLKFGIYEDYGNKTCGGYPGSLNHLETDANTFAAWGVDMLKLDGCYSNISTMDKGYPQMTKYLNATGRPILFSCSWPDYLRAKGLPINYSLVAENCNIWRNYFDINDAWQSVLGIIDYYAANQDTLIKAAGPGHFNDPDMLIVGDFSLSVYQARTQFAMWAVMAAPLLMSNDLRNMDSRYQSILLNKGVIAVNQDPLGMMGRQVLKLEDGIEVWLRPLAGQAYAMVIMSRSERMPINFKTSLKVVGVPLGKAYLLTDLWANKPLRWCQTNDTLSFVVDPCDSLIYRLTPQ